MHLVRVKHMAWYQIQRFKSFGYLSGGNTTIIKKYVERNYTRLWLRIGIVTHRATSVVLLYGTE